MKTINGKEAYELLNNASAVILDDDALIYPSIDSDGTLGQEEDEYTMNLSYIDNEGLEYSFDFIWQTNSEIDIKNNYLLLKDDTDTECRIIILESKTL